MKLIHRTYIYALVWLIPVIIIGSLFGYYTVKYIVYEETDEFLTYEMERLVSYHKVNNDLPEFHKVAGIIENMKTIAPVFKDTMILEPGDNEMVPHRELYFSINHNGKDFTIILRHLLPGNDDILEGTVLLTFGFLILIAVILFLMVSTISGRIWKPFYKTLNTLTKYQITEPLPVFHRSGIAEFNSLNRTAEGLLKKISRDYKRTKEFNENASHELQTHLAIIRANTEKLLNNSRDGHNNPEQIQAIYNATVKLSSVQKSLLLLSKIGNMEFNKSISVNLADTLRHSLELFLETIEIRNLTLSQDVGNSIQVMDGGLAGILFDNLLKNAVKHNNDNGFISIHLNQYSFKIENSGLPFDGDPASLLERFSIGEKGNLGLGLAIVKQICDLYNFGLTYKIEGNVHRLQIFFPVK